MSRDGLKLLVLGSFLTGAVAIWLIGSGTFDWDHASAAVDDGAKSKAAFIEASKVFFSPRCANCHPAGDAPTQGDERRVHDQDIKRGADGKGLAGMECSTCHQADNLDGDGLPPGAPNWHMPPADNKLVFQGLTAGQLCRQLKEPARKEGSKSLKESIRHVETDPLVKWAWAPGGSRMTPPISQSELIKKLNEWIDNGASCPE